MKITKKHINTYSLNTLKSYVNQSQNHNFSRYVPNDSFVHNNKSYLINNYTYLKRDYFNRTLYSNLNYKLSQITTFNKEKLLDYLKIKNISSKHENQNIRLIARVHKLRKKGKLVFIILREELFTCQAILDGFNSDIVGVDDKVKELSQCSNESLLEIEATVVSVNKKIESCYIKDYELLIKNFKVLSESVGVLPFQMEDAMRKQESSLLIDEMENKINNIEDNKGNKKCKEKELNKKEIFVNTVTRLDNRVLDLRVPSTLAVMKIQSEIGKSFRDFLFEKEFIEIHTPKTIKGSSEGGTAVFEINYYGEKGCLAQSPQLYKQMAVIGGMDKVFEIAPVFRAENSTGNRHMAEFTMLDLEMSLSHITSVESKNYCEDTVKENDNVTFKLNYLANFINYLFIRIFDNVKSNCNKELEAINSQFAFEYISYNSKPTILSFHEGVSLLNKYGNDQKVNEDLSESSEKLLGEIIKKEFNTDFFFLLGYPKSTRPFYTKINNLNSEYTYSFDAFIRGEEVLSGAIREENYDELIRNVEEKGVSTESLSFYLDSFKLGAPIHGGCGIGLERIVKLLLNYNNVKKCALFPRDPKRIIP